MRQEKLTAFKETGLWPGSKVKAEAKVAWSNKVDKKAKRMERKRKKELKAESKKAIEQEETAENSDGDDASFEEDDDLEADYRLIKKLKKSKGKKAVRSTTISIEVTKTLSNRLFHTFFQKLQSEFDRQIDLDEAEDEVT